MIQEILGQVFPIEYGIDPDTICVPIHRYNEPFSESDIKTCDSCKNNPKRVNRTNCNREILKVDNKGKEVAVVEYEKYIAQFERKRVSAGDRCDLIMADSGTDRRKIVFCDLCCYEEKYVEPNAGKKYPEGKRAKARQQMERSIEKLIQESTTAVNLLTYSEKVCLFAWRDYDVPDVPVMATRGNARSNVQAFGSVASNMASTTTSHYQKLGHEFIFMQIKYPSVYKW